MEFTYTEYELPGGDIIVRPTVPVTLRYKKIEVFIGHALVDTGADMTILPLEFAEELGMRIDVDHSEKILLNAAGGGKTIILRSPEPIQFILKKSGFRSYKWNGYVYFSSSQSTVLLGYEDCLENFNLTFKGQAKTLIVRPV